MNFSKTGAPLFLLLLFFLLLGFLHPAPALAASFLFCFFVPGFILVRAMALRLQGLEFAFVAIASSIVLSTFFVNFSSFFLKAATGVEFEWLGVSLGFLLVSLPLLFLDVSLKRELGDISKSAKEHKLALGVSAFVFVFVFFVLSNSLWVQTADGVKSNGWNWSDFLYHHSIIQSVLNGNFPPQTPFFAGAPLVYHWFADFHAAILASGGGISAVHAVVFENSLFAFLIALGSYLLALNLLKSKSAAILAALLVVFGGGMGYLVFFQNALEGGEPLKLVSLHSYDNNWEGGWNFAGYPFRVPSVLGAGIYAWRAMAAALPILIACALLLFQFREERDGKKAALAGVIAGMAVPFHFYLLPAVFLLALFLPLLAIFEEATRWRERGIGFLRFSIMAAIVSTPFVLPIFFRVSEGSGVFLNLGWESHAADLPSFAAFYALNLGAPFLLALASLFFVAKKELGAKWILALWAFALFLVPNIVSFSSIAFDMNKFFSFMWVPVCILAASVLVKIPKPAIAVAVAASVLSPLLVSAWFLSSNWIALSNDQLAAANWIEENTPRNAVFATAATINEPTDLAGRVRLLTFPPYALNLGLGVSEREADLRAIYCGSAEESASVMNRLGASFVIDDFERSSSCGHAFSQSALFEKVFEQGGTRIYRLSP